MTRFITLLFAVVGLSLASAGAQGTGESPVLRLDSGAWSRAVSGETSADSRLCTWVETNVMRMLSTPLGLYLFIK